MSNIGEEIDVKEQEKKFKLARLKEKEELSKLLNSAGGRWFLWRLLQKCGLYSTTSHLDPHRMAIESGKRDVGLWVIEQVNEVDPAGYMKLVKEAKNREI